MTKQHEPDRTEPGVTRVLIKPLASFAPNRFPALSRQAYLWELRSAFFIPAAIACVEGNVIGVIADKAFNAPPWVIAVLAAGPALANISSVAWTRLFHGHNRVRVITIMQSLALLGLIIAAASPFNNAGLAVLVLGVLLARFAYAGVLVARTDVWRANYPRETRARAAGKFATVNSLVFAGTGALIGGVMDLATSETTPSWFSWPIVGEIGVAIARLDENAYRVMFTVCVLIATVGVWMYSHIRWRGAAAHLRQERQPAPDDTHRHAASPSSMLKVLKDDQRYRKYQIAQFILGVANLSAIPIFIIALSDTFSMGYTQSLVLTQVLPVLLPVASIPLWARLLDRVHVARFRMYHSWFFVAALMLTGIGMTTEALPLIYAARIILGIAFGGGMLAWTLGHHDFASRQAAPLYMGIHAALTGVRGVFAPFVGVLLYQGITLTLPGDERSSIVIPSLGSWTFFVLAGIGVVGAIRFYQLARSMARESKHNA